MKNFKQFILLESGGGGFKQDFLQKLLSMAKEVIEIDRASILDDDSILMTVDQFMMDEWNYGYKYNREHTVPYYYEGWIKITPIFKDEAGVDTEDFTFLQDLNLSPEYSQLLKGFKIHGHAEVTPWGPEAGKWGWSNFEEKEFFLDIAEYKADGGPGRDQEEDFWEWVQKALFDKYWDLQLFYPSDEARDDYDKDAEDSYDPF
jgi:hypothetical protein